MTAKENIRKLFEASNELSIKEIVDRLGISKQMAHIAVNQLLAESVLEKMGRTPKTIYRIKETAAALATGKPSFSPSQEDRDFLQKDFLMVTESGSLLEGADAFSYWCAQRRLPVEKTLAEYLLTKKKYEVYYNAAGIINGMEKLKNTKGYSKIYLDGLYYLDFYAIEKFSKTRLGTLLHYAKQGQNKYLIGIMMDEIGGRLRAFLGQHQADAIGFVPPTIRRELQLMKFMQAHLNAALPVIEIRKISGIIPVPQKSLSKLEERIKNAANTFAITERRAFGHIVLIDDAVGSGATLNEVAGKIKNRGIAQKITGLAIVGSFKGFDVISDV